MILELSGNCISWRLLKSNFVIIVFRLDRFKIWKKKYHYASRPTSFPRVNFIGMEGTTSPRENRPSYDLTKSVTILTILQSVWRGKTVSDELRRPFARAFQQRLRRSLKGDRTVRRNTTVILYYGDPSVYMVVAIVATVGGKRGGQYPRTRDPSRKR